MADAVAEFLAPAREDRHDLLITHNFVIAWFVREVFGAPDLALAGPQPGQLRADDHPGAQRRSRRCSSPTTTSGTCRSSCAPACRAPAVLSRYAVGSPGRIGSTFAYQFVAFGLSLYGVDLELAARAVERARGREARVRVEHELARAEGGRAAFELGEQWLPSPRPRVFGRTQRCLTSNRSRRRRRRPGGGPRRIPPPFRRRRSTQEDAARGSEVAGDGKVGR